jgi:hypothetical protein
MKPIKLLFFFLLASGLALSACVTSAPPAGSTGVITPTVPQQTATPEGKQASSNPAEKAAVDQLAARLNLPAGQITVVSIESQEWPDSCLGYPQPGEMCAMIVTPGYLVVLTADGKTFDVHTNLDGSEVRLPPETQPTPTGTGSSDLILTWLFMKDKECLMANFTAEGVMGAPCVSSYLKLAPYVGEERVQELNTLVQTYQSFQASTPVGDVTFVGKGQAVATPEEQRSLAEWASLVYQESQAGRSSAAQGLAFSWHREGGIAGFCDDLGVYMTGFAIANSCKGGAIPTYRLTADELKTLYGIVDRVQRFEYEQTDPAAADGMTQHLVFEGLGSQVASGSDQQAVLELAGEVFAAAAKTK